MLKLRKLGQTNIKVSEISLGTVKFGRNQQVKYPIDFKIPDDKEASDILAFSHNLGINLLDTAPAYGTSEERLGNLLKGQREKWIISSKVGEEFVNGKSIFDFTPEHIIRSVERSLIRLKTDYIDIMLIHSNGDDENIIKNGALEILNDLKKKGLIRAIGMSTKTIAGGMKAIESSDVAMVTYNPWLKEEELVILKAKEINKGILVKKVLNSGNLNNGGCSYTAEQAIQFALAQDAVSSVVIGSINKDNIQKNINYANSI